MSDKTNISVIIPVFRDWDNLKNCLKSLANQSLSTDKWEIILVNNDPQDPFPEFFSFPENAILLTQEIPGSYAARNLGVKKSNAEIVAFLDSDCKPDKDWLSNGLKRFEEGGDLIGGRVDFYKTEDGSELIFEFEKAFSFNQKNNVERFGRSVTANLFVKKSVFDKIGFFSEDSLSGEDFNWTQKATKSGFKLVYGDRAIVEHPARKTFQNILTKKKRTAGGLYITSYQGKSKVKSIITLIKYLRPPITVFALDKISFGLKAKLFCLKWYREWVGVIEILRLLFTNKKPERT